MIEIDVRGYSCPIPVVNTKKAMKDNPGKELEVLVESAVSKENVTRLAESEGYSAAVEEIDDGYKLVLKPGK
ncbi:MAG: sulfurtransferase TusA family protein [Dehalococcoidales bacterium]|nr:sulfurtransferase TusA family protein [Dehalococcoidales bacterium]